MSLRNLDPFLFLDEFYVPKTAVFKEQALGLQLWLNLPKEHKMCKQQCQEFLDAQISCTKSQDEAVIKAIAGDSHGVKFQIYTRTPAMFFELYDLSVVTVVVDGSNLHGTSTRS
ncbi:hypothetical protein K457DRAFT_22355 [Linnemannia elongata AG-77]|uniref:Uncharacterized protein n=1 Tax=Linnemannia elongata AG-77 TaxID=1314771 RepID=A0A197JPD9_9FUNG|nr:hypothetical protein K457DRAFT_22355 [Linnemannia elongata AG-77]